MLGTVGKNDWARILRREGAGFHHMFGMEEVAWRQGEGRAPVLPRKKDCSKRAEDRKTGDTRSWGSLRPVNRN